MEGLRHPVDFQRPWEERRKAEIEIDDSDTLGAILKRGNEALGSELPPETYDTYAFVDFFVEGRSSIKLRNELVLLDREGHVRWTWKWAEEPYSELLRAHDAGVLVGDPTRVYVLRQPGMGNGVLADFPTYVELLRLAFEVLGAASTLDWLRNRIGRGEKAADAIGEHHVDWEANGGMPHKLWEFLHERPWKSAELARLLGTSVDETEGILLSFGFVRGADGYWRPGEDAFSEFLAGNAEFLLHSPHVERRWVRLYLQERIDEFAERGEASRYGWPELPTMPPPDWQGRHYPPSLDPTPREKAIESLRWASREARYWLRAARSQWRKRRH